MKKSKEPASSRVVLKLKVQDTEFDRLQEGAELCVKAMNAGLWDWLERTVRGREELPEQVGKSEGTKIYHAIRREFEASGLPLLNAMIFSGAANAVQSNVSAKVDWRKRGTEKSKKRSDEIQSYDQKPPFFTKRQLLVPCRIADASFGDRLILEVSHVTLQAPRKPNPPLFMDISTKQLSSGHKKLIRRCISGDLKLADSKIVLKDDSWYWHLPIAIPFEPMNSDAVMHLWPTIPPEGISQGRPFRIAFEDGGRDWFVGDGRYLLSQETRFTRVKKEIGWRYRQRNGTGHGRKKIDAQTAKYGRRLMNIRDEFRRRAIADVVRQADRRRIGRLIFHEPTNPVKERLWFAESGTDFDWTRFGADLKNALAKIGTTVEVQKLNMKEVCNAA